MKGEQALRDAGHCLPGRRWSSLAIGMVAEEGWGEAREKSGIFVRMERMRWGFMGRAGSRGSLGASARGGGAGFEGFAGSGDFPHEDSFVGKLHFVLGREDFGGEIVEGVAGNGLVFLGTEDEADGGLFPWAEPVFASVIEIHVHLSGVFV